MPKTPSVPARIKNKEAAEAFVEWSATPKSERELTKKGLADRINVSRETFYNWEESAWFQQMVRHRVLSDLGKERREVYDALKQEAKSGNVRAITLYSELLGDHVQQIDVTSGGESLSEEDARMMSTEELAESLIEERIESESFRKQLEKADMNKESVAELLVELFEATA